MTALAEAVDVTVHEPHVRIAHAEASQAVELVRGQPASEARNRLRFGPGRTYEQVARLLDKALADALDRGLASDILVVATASVAPAEDIVRIRRQAHGVADWISSPTSEITLVLRPQGLAATADEPRPEETAREVAAPEREPETAAALEVREQLYDVIDPDLGVNIVDLGFVRHISLDDDGVATITMTLTSAACPLTEVMERNIAAVLAESGTGYTVDWEWLPSWRPQDITEDGREQLRAIGFSAF